MAIRATMQRIGEPLARAANDLPGSGDGLAEQVTGAIQAIRSLDPANCRVMLDAR